MRTWMPWLLVVLVGCSTPHAPWAQVPGHHAALHDPDGPAAVELVIHAAEGKAPVAGVAEDVAAELSRAIQKPVSVRVEPYATQAGADARWSADNLWALAGSVRAEKWPLDTVLLHAVSLPGCYATADRPCIGGVEVNDVAFVFFDGQSEQERVPDVPSALAEHPWVGDRSVQRFLLMHELGHAIGLVNTPVPPIDAGRIAHDGCSCHSTDPDSVMTGRGALVSVGPSDHGHYIGQGERLAAGEWHNFRFNGNDMDDLRAYQASL